MEYILVVDADERFGRDTVSVVRGLGLHAAAAISVDHALHLAEQRRPTLLLSDIDVGGELAGIALASEIHKRWGASAVLMTLRSHRDIVRAIAGSSAEAILCKPFHRVQLEMSLRLAIERRAIADRRRADGRAEIEAALREIAGVVRRVELLKETSGRSGTHLLLSRLRPREQEIVALLLQHHRVPGIARLLGISAYTVRNHLKRVFKALGVHSQQELLARLQRPNPDRPLGMPDRSSTSGD